MSEHETNTDESTGNLGPEDGTDDATKADMGFAGTPAQSATPVGQGEGPGTGADDDGDADDETD